MTLNRVMQSFVILAEILATNAAGVQVPVRMASVNATPNDVLINGQSWLPAITSAPTIRITLPEEISSGDLQVDWGQITFRFSAELGNYGWSALNFDGAATKIWRGLSGSEWAGYSLIFDGDCGPLERGNVGQGALILRGPEGVLTKDSLTGTYAGTGGIEGPIALKGTLKPRAYGICENIDPILINASLNIYQFDAYNACDDVTAVYENAVTLQAPVGTVPTDYAALAALTLAPGQWAKAPAIGCFRLGAAPSGKITADVRGSRDGGSFVSSPAAVAAKMLKDAGVSGGSIDTTSLNAVDTSANREIGNYIKSQTQWGELVRKALGDAFGYAFYNPLSQKWTFGRNIATKTPIVIKGDGSQTPMLAQTREGTAIAQTVVQAPVWKVRVGHRRCWSTHSDSEISFLATITEMGDWNNTQVYFDGNVVTYAVNGRRYRYIAATPTAGNLPTDTAFWEQISGPIDFGTIVGSTRPEDNSTRNEDAGNLIPTANTLAGADFSNGANLQTISGQAMAAVVGGAGATVLYSNYQPVRGGQLLHFEITGHVDTTTVDFVQHGYNWKDAAGNVFAEDLPNMAFSGSEAIGIAASVTKKQSVRLPAGAVSARLYALRPNWSGIATFLFRRPWMAHGERGATEGAPAGTNVAGQLAELLVSDAAAATATLNAISADGILHRSEKPEVRKQRETIEKEHAIIIARADARQVSRAALDTAYTNLIAYLDVLALGSETDTEIVRSVFNFRFSDYFEKRQAVLDAIAAWSTRNEDGGGNMIASPITLSDVIYGGGSSPDTINGIPMAAVLGSVGANALFGEYVKVRGGERIYFGITGYTDVSTVDTLQLAYNWADSAGNVYAVDLPDMAFNGTEAIGFSNSKTKGQWVEIPLNAVSARLYARRNTWSVNGTFRLRQPFMGRAQPSADVTSQNTAANTNAVGSSSAGDVVGRGQLIDPSTGRATNRRIIPQIMGSGVIQIINTNPLSASTDTSGVATININPHVVADDAGTVSYSGSSIGGLSASTNYYVYEINPNYAGGARTYSATTDRNLLATPGARFVGFVTTPGAGGSNNGIGAGAGFQSPGTPTWEP